MQTLFFLHRWLIIIVNKNKDLGTSVKGAESLQKFKKGDLSILVFVKDRNDPLYKWILRQFYEQRQITEWKQNLAHRRILRGPILRSYSYPNWKTVCTGALFLSKKLHTKKQNSIIHSIKFTISWKISLPSLSVTHFIIIKKIFFFFFFVFYFTTIKKQNKGIILKNWNL